MRIVLTDCNIEIVCVLDAFVKCLVCVAIGNRVMRFYNERDVNQLTS